MGLLFPHLKPPSFRCTDATANSVHLHYYSERPGLAPLVIGLVKGLARRFDTPISVTLARRRANGFDHDEFLVTVEQNSI